MVSPAATVATAATTVVLHHDQGQDRDPRVNHPYLPFHTDFYSGFYKMSDKHWRLCQHIGSHTVSVSGANVNLPQQIGETCRGE